MSILAQEPVIIDLCSQSPCGANTICNNGSCSCISEYLGDPYTGCRPECILSIECDRDKACVRNKCVDPCPGTCGQNAECKTINHIPTCTCAKGFSGNAFVSCSKQSMWFFSTAKISNYNWILCSSFGCCQSLQSVSMRSSKFMSSNKFSSCMLLCTWILG